LPDLIEASGRTWKTYQEDMPYPCALGDHGEHGYVQHHNPFVYFDPIRLDQARCQKSVVPLEMLQTDIQAGNLPNFMFVTPNMCHNSHDCNVLLADGWLMGLLTRLIPALERESRNYLVVLNWDEGDQDGSCCGLPESAGGRIPVVLISPLVKDNFQDPTPYTHYSLLKTISKAWGLPGLGHASDKDKSLILAPWK
jgi:phosphatidylinositol-3-phosphatase